MKLVIVESPNKCHTISRYLGEGYEVLATVGHLRDLSTSGKGGFGVDVDHDFKPTYIISSSKRHTVYELQDAAAKAKDIFLATDPDREGEAIAWHLTQILGLPVETTKRLEFHEITRDSITTAIKNPRVLDMNLVEAQEARRIVDRIIGFKLSNIMQKKIKSPSAGRVQSATLKLIVEHDDEIANFIPEPYWTLSLELNKGNAKINASFQSFDDIKKIEKEADNKKIISLLGDKVVVKEVKKSVRTTESKPAFTTSTLQQEAFNTYKFSTKKTSSLAQQLYEGVEIRGQHTGLITYIRTDSTYLSDTFVQRASDFITKKFGAEYVGKRKIVKVNGAQNAHEAIRPTSNHNTPESMRQYLTPDQYKLYKLIYERAVGSLMVAKKENVISVIFECNGVTFKSEGTSIAFDGYTRLYKEEKADGFVLPSFKVGEELTINKVNNEKKMTEPPAAYTEAKIVKLMEDKKIGRPSTYASTIQTLLKRGYIESKQGSMVSTEQGKKTAIVLGKYFPEFVDVKYTAQMEEKLDKIQEGEISRTKTLSNFYKRFVEEVDKANAVIYKEEDEPTGKMCPICGAPLVYKKSKFGDFIGCSNFPKCKYREKEVEPVEYTGEMCPKCGAPLVYRINKQHKKFVACSAYPKCDYIKKEEQEVTVVKKCPECGGDLVVRGKGKRKFLGCTNYPKCKHIEKIN